MIGKDGDPCSSPACVANRIEKALVKQHELGMDSIKEILSLSMSSIGREIGDLKKVVESNGNEMFGRLRSLETGAAARDAQAAARDEQSAVRDKRIEDIAVNMLKKEDVEKIVSAELGKEPAIRTVKALKSWTFKVAVIVGAAAITAVLVFGRDMYVAHRPSDTKQGAVKQ